MDKAADSTVLLDRRKSTVAARRAAARHAALRQQQGKNGGSSDENDARQTPHFFAVSSGETEVGALPRGSDQHLSSLLVRLSELDGLIPALEEVLDAAIELVHADGGYIRLFNTPAAFSLNGMPEDFSGSPFVAQRGHSEEFITYFSSLRAPVNPKVRQSLTHGVRRIIEDMTTHPDFEPHRAQILECGFRSMQGTPMRTRDGRAVGGICTTFIRSYTPPEEDLRMLDMYARLAASVIERQEQIESLKLALAAKDQFLGLVSHELRTPMTVIRGLSSILNRNPDLPHEGQAAVFQDLAKESERLYGLIENMLALAKAQAGRAPDLEPLSVNPFMEKYAGTLRKDLPGLDLSVGRLSRDEVVLAVPAYVEQVLHNLVENAYKYSLQGSPIRLRADRTGESVEISVSDRGIGLTHPETLFEPFERGEDAQQLAAGLGLGLAVCKTLVASQGGRLSARARKGGGSVFSFTLQRLD